MNKFATFFAALAIAPGVFSVMLTPSLANHDDARLIVPGKSIGKMALGSNGTKVLNRFRKPDIQDAGMSQTRQIWLGEGSRNTTLYIHTVANAVRDAKPQEGITIDEARTSSATFHTASGIRVGSTLRQIQDSFPHMHRDQAERPVVLYSDSRRGIAFEFADDRAAARCIGITVSLPGEKHILSSPEISSLISDYRPKRAQ